MVRDLHADAPPARTAVRGAARAAGARAEPDAARDADPSELYMKDDGAQASTRKPRNKRHGRPR